eukprot:974037-Prymnesium_polylepis.1
MCGACSAKSATRGRGSAWAGWWAENDPLHKWASRVTHKIPPKSKGALRAVLCAPGATALSWSLLGTFCRSGGTPPFRQPFPHASPPDCVRLSER